MSRHDRQRDTAANPAPGSRKALWAGVGGFVAGAVFWHLVGFWSFVSQVVYNQDEAKSPSRLVNLEEAKAVSAAGGALLANALSRAADAKVAAAETREAAPPASSASDGLHELLQCTQVRRISVEGEVALSACAPVARRLPNGQLASRGDRQMDAREAEHRLLNGWSPGVSRIETGSLD
ncbi:MAG: hypothetical protein JNM89_05600 [Hyphomicrobiaceae bacterium]|nr:hypothetical protein [Hyphomicrobiaceae bacterium]